MGNLGYSRVEKLVYRQSRSESEVEHYVYFSFWGSPKQYFTAHYDFFDIAADSFAVKEIKKLAGLAYDSIKFASVAHGSPEYPLGRLAKWEPRDSIYLPSVSVDVLKETITDAIEHKLLPLAQSIQTTQELFNRLIEDSEPMRWYFSNAAIRAAQIVFLSHKLKKPAGNVLDVLLTQSKYIASQLSREIKVKTYIDQLLIDAEEAP
jgi:hypothetical protein